MIYTINMICDKLKFKQMKLIGTIIFLFVFSGTLFAQEATTEEKEKAEKDKPVSAPYESGYLIDAQTSVISAPKTLEFVIQHKFGSMENGKSDLWGIYAPGANVRLGLDYVIRKNLLIGAGITKKNMYTDLNAKWTIFEQTKGNTIPVAVTVYGNVAIDGRNISAFESGTMRVAYQMSNFHPFNVLDRLSYFSQLIVGRRFNSWLSLQTAVSFTHYNAVPTTADHDKVGIHFSGRAKVSPQGSIIFNYDMPLKIKSISEQREWINPPKPNLAIGYEMSTFTHAFQVYVGTADGIIPQDIMMWNQRDWTDNGLAIGFTITRLWMF